jgi:hypothetical protein
MVQEDDTIHAAYVLYLDFSTGSPQPARRAYEYYDIGNSIGDVDACMMALAKNALDHGDNPRPYTRDFKYFVMNRVSYVFVVVHGAKIDISDAKIFEGKDKNNTINDGTHTFLYQGYKEIDLGDGRDLDVVYYVNSMTAYAGKKRLKAKEWEDFRLKLKLHGGREILGDDSGGTNMGPPVPPPERKSIREDA